MYYPLILFFIMALFIGVGVAIKSKAERNLYNVISHLFMFVGLLIGIITTNLLVIMSENRFIQSNIGVVYQLVLWSSIFIIGLFIILFIRDAVVSARKTNAGEEEEEL